MESCWFCSLGTMIMVAGEARMMTNNEPISLALLGLKITEFPIWVSRKCLSLKGFLLTPQEFSAQSHGTYLNLLLLYLDRQVTLEIFVQE